MENKNTTPMLFPIEPTVYWAKVRQIIQEEIKKTHKEVPDISRLMETPGLTQKPLYKISEICLLFNVTRPTIYDWVKHGKLKPRKIRSRVYFLGKDIDELINAKP